MYNKYPLYLVIINIFLSTFNLAYANSEIGTLDNTHYIPPVYAREDSDATAIEQHFLMLSTPETTAFNVTIRNADNSINQTVSISSTSSQTIELSAGVYGTSALGALNIVTDTDLNSANTTDGLILTGPQKFYANIRHVSSDQAASLIAKGQTALGQRFRSGHLRSNEISLNKKAHFISVMAVEDNTVVTFDNFPAGLQLHEAASLPSDITLDQYESYIIAMQLDEGTNSTIVNELNGTLVTSDKPIVMNSGSFLSGAPNSVGAGRDIGIAQIIPTDYLGKNFVLVKGFATGSSNTFESPIVVADTDTTEIYLNGAITPYDTIDAGEYTIIPKDEYTSEDVMFIRTSEPAYIYQSTSGNNASAPSMNFVPAFFDNLETQDLVIPDVDLLGTPTISIVAPTTAVVTVDSVDLTGGEAITGTADFVLYTVDGKTDDVTVSSTETYSLTLFTYNGTNRGSSAYYIGFPNSYAIKDITTTQELTPVIIDVQDNDINGNNTFTVSPTLAVSPTNGTAVINPDGTITYTPNAGFTTDTFSYTITNGLALTDTAEVIINLDTDADGVADSKDLDSDNDGIPDSVEDANSPESNDTDGDGIEDKFDLDSDNDGIFDLVEADHAQQVDTNNDGRIDDSVFVGSNGLVDALETVAESGTINYSPRSTDDAIENYIDTDSDDDGLIDNIEAQNGSTYIPPNGIYDANGVDTAYTNGLTPANTVPATDADYINADELNANSDVDGDEIPDLIEVGNSNNPVDTDDDDILDYLDLDSDGDGIPDSVEAGEDPANPVDTDGDSIPDYLDLDSDGDGIPDAVEAGENPTEPVDTDDNGTPDYLDLDSDGDGILDAVEAGEDPTNPVDTDGDNTPDYLDLDSDGDQFLDADENGDFNNNGIPDSSESEIGNLETAVSGAGSTNAIMLILLIIVGLTQRMKNIFCSSFKKSVLSLLIVVMATFFPAHASAASENCGVESEDVFESCWYVGLGLGKTHVDPEGQVNGWSTDKDDSDGYNLHVGKRFSPKWYWEFSYVDAGEAGLGNVNPALNNVIPDAAIDYKIPSLMVGYYLWEKHHGFNFYGKAGVSVINSEANDSRIGEEKQSSAQLALGFGAEYRFNESPWFAQLQFDSFDRDASYLSLRISRFFGGSKKQQTIVTKSETTPPAVTEVAPMNIPVPVETPEINTDSDEDGILDDDDQCPQTPASTPVDQYGCALFTGVIQGINFENNKAILTTESRIILDETVNTLNQFPNIQVEVQAHTDSQGDETYNQQLSERRAQSVVDYLVDKGIERKRLVPKGYGEMQPLVDNDSRANRAKNRRVELSVINN